MSSLGRLSTNRLSDGFDQMLFQESLDSLHEGIHGPVRHRTSTSASGADTSMRESLLADRQSKPDGLEIYLDFSKRNFAIFSNCFCVGYCMYYIQAPLWFYMIDELDAPAAQQTVVNGLMYLPWGLKLLWGLVVDTCWEGKRKPFIVIGWSLFILANLALIIMVKPTIMPLAFLTFTSTVGYVLADVATDAMMVERSQKCERSSNHGQLQARAYISRFAGGMVGCLLSAVIYNKDAWGWGLPFWAVLCVYIVTPLVCLGPFLWNLEELSDFEHLLGGGNIHDLERSASLDVGKNGPASSKPNQVSLKEQFKVLYDIFQQRACWLPCSFIFFYNASLLVNPAWNSFLVIGLNFSNLELGMLTLLGNVLAYLSLVVYKRWYFHANWRTVYVVCTVLYLFFTSLQFVLIFGWNNLWGMGAKGFAIFFALSSYGMVQFIQGIQFLPSCRLYLALCPKGSEGTAYAMLTSLANLATTVAYPLAASLSHVWDVSNDTIKDGHYDGMWKLTLLCSLFVVPVIFCVSALPTSYEHTLEIIAKGEKSKGAGISFSVLVGSALIFTIVYTLITMI